MEDLPIIVLEMGVEEDRLFICGEFENVRRARRWIIQEADNGVYRIVRKVEVKTVKYEKIETRVVQ